MFIDEVTVKLKAGDGGSGCVSFRRERNRPKGGPDGGGGGKGGDVILVCNENTGDLTAYKFKPHAHAENGQPGRGNDKDGRGGVDILLPVPPGTIVLSKSTGKVATELIRHEETIVLLKGGQGGLGNIRFKSSINRTPRQSTPGQPGQGGGYQFVLKIIADVGLVGLPNAGKSSLTGLITRAHPKTAPYPFTTLHPNVGVVEIPEEYARFLMADIPGLVAGAYIGKGLGHRFLRHIERCPLHLFIIDMAGVDGRDPTEDYEQLLQELGHYNPRLLQKPHLVAANKMDLAEAPSNLKLFRKKHPQTNALPISCLLQSGIEDLKMKLYSQLQPKSATP